MRGISKRFGKVQALREVSFSAAQGSIHGIVGENGAGKSTLMKVLYGAASADEGSIHLFGKELQLSSSKAAIAAGIGMVSQHYGIIGELSRLENLIIGAEPSPMIDRSAIARQAIDLAQTLGIQSTEADWNASAVAMSASDAQRLEILKLLWRKSKVMILDEPTAMLSPADSDALFTSLKTLTESGATILLVTHKLPEIMAHCDRVTVLRGGELISDLSVSETNSQALAEMIVGKTMKAPSPPSAVPSGEPVLVVRNVSLGGRSGRKALSDVSFQINKGEMVGLAGVDGSGQAELMRVLFGVDVPERGAILWEGHDVTHLGPDAKANLGWRLLPEDRISQAIVSEWSIEENASLGIQRTELFAHGGSVGMVERRKAAEAFLAKFSARFSHVGQPIGDLSGGNQQRFVAGRMTETSPKFFLAFQPSRGLDIAATLDLYRAMQARCAAGAAGIVVSFDLDELLAHCHRVCVMYSGEFRELPSGVSRDELGRVMVGGKV
jgi:simple sugar transport system ATP-binding protein